MGGYGSTRWAWYSPKPLVEHTCSLSITALRQHVQIGAEGRYTGALSWRPSGASISFSLAGQQLTLTYRMRRGNGDAWHDRSDGIMLQSTRPQYGGRRWWFTCPICERRAGVVYLDSRRGRFSCRLCAGLAYRSQQEHDKTLDRYARMPWLAEDMLGAIARAPERATDTQLLQAMKAAELQLRLSARALRH